MNCSQYKNVIQWTLAHDPQACGGSYQVARAILANCGTPFPSGGCGDALMTLLGGDYMGWSACMPEQARECVNLGFPAVAISRDKVVVIKPDDGVGQVCLPEADMCSDFARQLDEISLEERADMQFFAFAAFGPPAGIGMQMGIMAAAGTTGGGGGGGWSGGGSGGGNGPSNPGTTVGGGGSNPHNPGTTFWQPTYPPVVPIPRPTSAPSGTSAANITPTGFRVSWNAVPNATEYEIQLNIGSWSGSWIRLGSSTLSHTFTGLNPGTNHTVTIRARNVMGEGPTSRIDVSTSPVSVGPGGTAGVGPGGWQTNPVAPSGTGPRLISESPTIGGRVIQIRRFECAPQDLQINLLEQPNGNLDRPGTGASFFVNEGARGTTRVMTALHWMNGRAVHRYGGNNFADRYGATAGNSAMSSMHLVQGGSRPTFTNRVTTIGGLGNSANITWALGGISLLLNEQHANNSSMRNRYLGLNGATALYPGMRENLIPGLTSGHARAFLAYDQDRNIISFGVMAPSIGNNITNSGITYFDMYTALGNLGFTRALNIDGGGSTRFRDGNTTTSAGVRDVVCQLTY